MRRLVIAALALSVAGPVSAATLHDQFTFTTDLTANIGSATATGAGTVGGGRYNLATNQGLSVTLAQRSAAGPWCFPASLTRSLAFAS